MTPADLRWTPGFAALGPAFSTAMAPRGVPDPHWVLHSADCAAALGLPADWTEAPAWNALAVMAGNAQWPGMQPLASVYSGHQFGVWAGQLGDGRALSLGQVRNAGSSFELQLKGAGLTPYSRGADGRAVLRSSIREFLASEALHALGIPTTRALALVGSPLPVRRETVETAAVLCRVAPSFLRFGHFEHFAHTASDPAALRQLADFALAQHFPDLQRQAEPVLALLTEVARRTARLVAQWQTVGFCHGVMNTDNMSLLGLTLDYGPYGFLDAFDPGHICNHTDQQGRYSWKNQPGVAFWNLHALAQALLPLLLQGGHDEAAAHEAARAAIEPFKDDFASALQQGWADKLGLRPLRPPGDAAAAERDRALADGWLRLLAADRVDFSIAWRRLCGFDSTARPVAAGPASHAAIRDLFIDRAGFDAWAALYAQRLRDEASVDAERALRMRRCNPKFVLRNHLAEVAIEAARGGDFSEVKRLHAVLQQPFDETADGDTEAYAAFPPDWAQDLEVSCSS